ncbi:hypothetical protein HMPREF3198_01155 [Winkia neuii]|nr:hypothetical protein HMPREF3198_01155 [Winkia neuii]
MRFAQILACARLGGWGAFPPLRFAQMPVRAQSAPHLPKLDNNARPRPERTPLAGALRTMRLRPDHAPVAGPAQIRRLKQERGREAPFGTPALDRRTISKFHRKLYLE